MWPRVQFPVSVTQHNLHTILALLTTEEGRGIGGQDTAAQKRSLKLSPHAQSPPNLFANVQLSRQNRPVREVDGPSHSWPRHCGAHVPGRCPALLSCPLLTPTVGAVGPDSHLQGDHLLWPQPMVARGSSLTTLGPPEALLWNAKAVPSLWDSDTHRLGRCARVGQRARGVHLQEGG